MQVSLVKSQEQLKKIIDLRKAILHPDGPMERVLYPADGSETAIHVAIISEDGDVMACGSMLMEDESEKESTHIGRIRGMAVSEKSQGKGLGGIVLESLLAEAKSRKVTKIWCNARTKILNFYLKRGFVSSGDEFITAGGIPHYRLVKSMVYGN